MKFPWWTPDAVTFVDKLLSLTVHSIHGFEWGSGASSHWLSERLCSLGTVEHDRSWLSRLEPRENLTAMFRPQDLSYEDAVNVYTHSPLGFIAIDGRRRVACVSQALPLLAPWGMLLLDDSQRDRYRPAVAAIDLAGLTRVHHSRDVDGLRETSVWQKQL